MSNPKHVDYLDAKPFSIRLTFTLHTFSENRLYWSSFCCCCVDADFLTPFADGIALFDTPFLYNSRSWFCCVSTVIVDSDVSLNCCSKSQKNWNLSNFSWINVHYKGRRNDFVDKWKSMRNMHKIHQIQDNQFRLRSTRFRAMFGNTNNITQFWKENSRSTFNLFRKKSLRSKFIRNHCLFTFFLLRSHEL